MGEVVNFPKARGAEKPPPPGGEQPVGRAVERGPVAQPAKRPSWGVFDDHDGGAPDAA